MKTKQKITHSSEADALKMPFGHMNISTLSVYIHEAEKSRKMGIFAPFYDLIKILKIGRK